MKSFPRLGLRLRRAWRTLTGQRSDYKASEINRLLRDWVAGNKAADQEILGDVRRLRARAREVARNEGVGRQFLRLLQVNVLGPKGPALQGKIRRADGSLDREANANLEAAWTRWARRPVTVDGRQNLRQFQAVALRALARDGELFVRKWFGFERNAFGIALQPIDADLLEEGFNRFAGGGQNEIRLGVEVDQFGAPVAYWFQADPAYLSLPGVVAESRGRYSVPAEEILHLFIPDRPNQTRGVSWLAPGLVPLRMLSGYEEAELVAARTAAAKMGFFEKPEGAGEAEEQGPGDMDASPGTMEELPPGWKFAGWDPTHPTAAFEMFVKTILRKIASAWGVSYNGLANDLEGVNYSSLRSGLLLERDYWRTIQEDWIDLFLDPVFAVWINAALLTGEVRLPSRDFRDYLDAVTWKPRGWAWVDPLKEIQAAEKAIQLGISSRTREAASRGDDFEEIVEELAQEEALAAEMGVSISPPAGGGTGGD